MTPIRTRQPVPRSPACGILEAGAALYITPSHPSWGVRRGKAPLPWSPPTGLRAIAWSGTALAKVSSGPEVERCPKDNAPNSRDMVCVSA